MSLAAGCPRCPALVVRSSPGPDSSWTCPEHGVVAPLWRPMEASYDVFTQHLAASRDLPTYLPWPLSPGWTVSDFGVVGADIQRPLATMTCSTGTSDPDGPVDVLIVAEEPGTGLGARCAGLTGVGPDTEVGVGPPAARVSVDGRSIPLWIVTTSSSNAEFDRSVLVGEAAGRWLWLVLRPAAALLLLRDEWSLRDISSLGAPLLELPFGGQRPEW